MKKLLTLSLVIGAILVGCNKNNDDSGTIAVTPTSDCLSYGYGYNGSCNYPYATTTGFTQYPYDSSYRYLGYSNQYSNGFCNCPTGHRPVYGAQMGLGCVRDTYIQQYPYNYQAYSWNTQRWNFQQVYDPYITTRASQSGCYSQVMTVCQVNVVNSCGTGGYCRPIGGGGVMGICVSSY